MATKKTSKDIGWIVPVSMFTGEFGIAARWTQPGATLRGPNGQRIKLSMGQRLAFLDCENFTPIKKKQLLSNHVREGRNPTEVGIVNAIIP